MALPSRTLRLISILPGWVPRSQSGTRRSVNVRHLLVRVHEGVAQYLAVRCRCCQIQLSRSCGLISPSRYVHYGDWTSGLYRVKAASRLYSVPDATQGCPVAERSRVKVDCRSNGWSACRVIFPTCSDTMGYERCRRRHTRNLQASLWDRWTLLYGVVG
jgi:hypothetical protein